MKFPKYIYEGRGMGRWQDDVGVLGRGGKLSMMCWNVGGWSKKEGARYEG